MALGAAGVLFVDILPRTTAFASALTKQITPQVQKLEKGLGASLNKVSNQVTGLGTSIGTNLGLGVAVAGVAAAKMAIDFDSAFRRIEALSNASAQDIVVWREQVLSLAGETAQAPKELADALFFLSSAGLDASQIMPALEASAKGAAVGLGSAADVANILASSLNAYADSGLTAAQATDVLVAAVREGRAEPDEFASALGRVLPIAAQAGVSFEDLSASIATLSNVGLPVDQAVTAMRGALQAIVAPGLHAAKIMEEVGISASDLLHEIRDEGLFGALEFLQQKIEGAFPRRAEQLNAFREIIPNVRALTGVLGITGQEAEKVQALFDRLTNSTGSLDKALSAVEAGPGFKMRQLFAELKVAAIQVGDALIPIADVLGSVLGPAFKFVADHAKGLVDALLLYAGVRFLPSLLGAIASGISAIGVASGVAAAQTALASEAAVGFGGETVGVASATKAAAVGATTFGKALGPIALGIGAVVIAGQTLQDTFFKNTTAVDDVAEAFGANLVKKLNAGEISMSEFNAEVERFNTEIAPATDEEIVSAHLLGIKTAGELATVGITDFKVAAVDALGAAADAANLAGHPFVEVSQEIDDAITDIVSTLNIGGRQVEQTNIAAAFDRALGSTPKIFEAAGVDVRDFVRSTTSAMRQLRGDPIKQVAAFGAATQEAMQNATAAVAEFQQQTAESMNFASQTFGDVADDFKGNSEKIARALRGSLEDQRQFGDDLNTLLEDGTQGSKALVQQLIAMGPAGQKAAHAIVTGSDEARRSIEKSLGTSTKLAEQFAVDVSKPIIGALKPIETFFDNLALALEEKFQIDINGDDIFGVDKDAKALNKELDRINEARTAHLLLEDNASPGIRNAIALLGDFAGTVATATLNIIRTFSGDPFGGGGSNNTPSETVALGGVIRGADGFVTRGPTFLVGESSQMTFAGKGAEAVLPLDDRGIAILAEAMRRAQSGTNGHVQAQMTDWSRGIVDLQVKQDWNSAMSFS